MFDVFLSIALVHALLAVALFTGFLIAGSVSVIRRPIQSANPPAIVLARKPAAVRVQAQPIDFDRVAA